jgi:nitrate reductase NapD
MEERSSITRRDFLTGQGPPESRPPSHHISSAVISVLPSHADEVIERLESLEGVEVHAAQGSKIVVVLEALSSGGLGERLIQISLLDGVITANMVFEYIDSDESNSS